MHRRAFLPALALGAALSGAVPLAQTVVLTSSKDNTLIEQPQLAARLSAGARQTGAHYDIQAFVRKMEQLYVLLHETSRASKRRSVLQADLSFLTS